MLSEGDQEIYSQVLNDKKNFEMFYVCSHLDTPKKNCLNFLNTF